MKQVMRRDRQRLLLAALLLLVSAQVAEAQPASDTAQATAQQTAADSADQLAEVVVTAEKRTQNVQEVPESIGVLSDTQLQQQNITSLQDLARAVPDLADTLPGNGTLGQGNFSIRGVSSSGSTAGGSLGQTTIGVYLDDVAMSTATGGGVGDTELEIFDVNRIEVLRGPQGTLYGASAMGGTIRYISNQPDLTAANWTALGTLSATQGGNMNYVEQAVGNIPLVTDKLALRMGAQVIRDSGFINNFNPYTGVTTPDANDGDSAVIHTTLKYQSADNSLTIMPSVFLQRYNNDGTAQALPNTHFLSEFYVPQVNTDKLFIPSLTIDKDLGWATLTSATSYFWRQFNRMQDGTDTLEANIFGVAYPTPFPGGDHTTQGAEELRLTSKSQAQSGLPFDWIAGAYYSDNHTTRWAYLYPQSFSTFEQLLINTYGVGGADAYGEFPYGSDLYTQYAWLRTGQLSGFGEFNYSPVKQLTVTVGLRYLSARQDAYNISTGYYNGPVPLVYTIGAQADHTSPKFALKYSYSENGQVYVNAVEGFRLGGVNQPIPNNPATPVGAACLAKLEAIDRASNPVTYAPDSLWSYELGDKSTLLGNRVTVDASLYDIIWKNVQQDIFLPGACSYDFIVNAGEAKSRGADLSVDTRLTRQLEFYASGNITHAVITTPALGTGETVGTWLEGVPRWQATAGFNLYEPVAGVTGFVSMDGNWVGEAHQFFNPSEAGFLMPEYFVLDSSIGVNLRSWQVQLFAKNLLNNDIIIVGSDERPYYGVVLRPRTIGLTVQKQM